MKYTKEDENKQWGIAMSNKLKKASDAANYYLIEARDIDWNGAQTNDGTKTINSSAELIDWIATKATATTPGGSGQSGVKAVTITVYKNLQTPMNDVAKPTVTSAYSFDSGNVDKLNGLQAEGWYLSSCFEKTMYVYSSTNTYTKFNDVIIESGWSDPVRFYNVEDITQSAAERAKEYYDQIIDGDGETLKGLVERATETLAEAELLIADAQADSSELATSIQAARELIASIQDGGTDTEKLLFTVNSLKAQMQTYGWHVGATATFEWLDATFNVDTDKEYNLGNFGTQFYVYDSYGIKVRCVKYGNVYESATNNRDKYILQLTDIDVTKLSQDDGQMFENAFGSNVNLLCLSNNAQLGESLIGERDSILNRLNTTPLFSTSAVSDKVTYTQQLTDAVKGEITSEIKTVDITKNTYFKSYASQTARDITNLVAKVDQKASTAQFTEWTQEANGIYAKAANVDKLNNTVKEGFQDIKEDLVSTGVYEKDQNGNYKYSGIKITKDYVKLDSNGTLVTIDGQGVDISNNLIVSGTVISDAIATDGIQVADRASIGQDGTLKVAIGTDGESVFNTDGTGYIAKGKIVWDEFGTMNIKANTIFNNFEIVGIDSENVDNCYFKLGTNIGLNTILNYNSNYSTNIFIDLPAYDTSTNYGVNGIDGLYFPKSFIERGLILTDDNFENNKNESLKNVSQYIKWTNSLIGSRAVIQLVDNMVAEDTSDNTIPNLDNIYIRGCNYVTRSAETHAATEDIDDFHSLNDYILSYINELPGSNKPSFEDFVNKYVTGIVLECVYDPSYSNTNKICWKLISVMTIGNNQPEFNKYVYDSISDVGVSPNDYSKCVVDGNEITEYNKN